MESERKFDILKADNGIYDLNRLLVLEPNSVVKTWNFKELVQIYPNLYEINSMTRIR